jgi:hypothetical protein
MKNIDKLSLEHAYRLFESGEIANYLQFQMDAVHNIQNTTAPTTVVFLTHQQQQNLMNGNRGHNHAVYGDLSPSSTASNSSQQPLLSFLSASNGVNS